MTRQTLGYRLGSMIGFILSGCLGAWAIVDAERQQVMLIAAIISFIAGLWLARRASKAIYKR